MSLQAALAERPARRAERRPVDFCCEVVAASGNRPRVQYAADVSAGGMWLKTLLPLALGEEVVVTLPAEQRSLCLFAEVVRVANMRDCRTGGRPGMAVRFKGLSAQERQHLAGYASDSNEAAPAAAIRDVLGWHFRAPAG